MLARSQHHGPQGRSDHRYALSPGSETGLTIIACMTFSIFKGLLFLSTEGHERAGASSGIGLALAELLAKSKEYVVIATARKPEVIKAKGEGISLLEWLCLSMWQYSA